MFYDLFLSRDVFSVISLTQTDFIDRWISVHIKGIDNSDSKSLHDIKQIVGKIPFQSQVNVQM